MTKKELIELLEEMHGEYLVLKAVTINSGEYYSNEDGIKDKFYGDYADKILKKEYTLANLIDILKNISLSDKEMHELRLMGFLIGKQ